MKATVLACIGGPTGASSFLLFYGVWLIGNGPTIYLQEWAESFQMVSAMAKTAEVGGNHGETFVLVFIYIGLPSQEVPDVRP
jgi:hypothetical protein